MSEKSGDLTQLRREYVADGLMRSDMAADPVEQFSTWFDIACQARPDDASSMTLATASKTGMPSARIVLLKHFDTDGFAWYTDYESNKGKELAENPQAELMFYWYGLERQIRIQGRVEKLDPAKGEAYFHARPLGSQLSAAISHQSAPVESREELEARVDALSQRCGDQVERPERWGGYRLVPQRFEFWQGRENRLHDRFCYTLTADGWALTRLQP